MADAVGKVWDDKVVNLEDGQVLGMAGDTSVDSPSYEVAAV